MRTQRAWKTPPKQRFNAAWADRFRDEMDSIRYWTPHGLEHTYPTSAGAKRVIEGTGGGARHDLRLFGESARELLASLAMTVSGEWGFPGRGRDGPLTKNALYKLWIRARDTAGTVAERLLGHRRATTTNRYVHLDDATLSQAAERVAVAIQVKLLGMTNRVMPAGEV